MSLLFILKGEERESLNDKGMSFVEACLCLFIFFIIVGSIIPLSYRLKETLLDQKLKYHASEVALDAAKIIKTTGQTKGGKTIDQVQYDWYYTGDEICVSYKKINVTEKKCISRKK